MPATPPEIVALALEVYAAEEAVLIAQGALLRAIAAAEGIEPPAWVAAALPVA